MDNPLFECGAPAVPTLHTFVAFAVVAVASSSLAEWLRKSMNLPLITGYILGGIICGPYVVAILSRIECSQLAVLITDDAMGFIGFSAGSKFLLSELSGSLKAVLYLLVGQLIAIYVLVFGGITLASPWLQITSDGPPETTLSIALIVACLAVARSPSSAIALVSELSAHGTFTTAVLSVTVLIDVVVVVIFALTLVVVRAVAPSPGEESPSVTTVLGLFALQMAVSAVVGVLLGYVLHGFISCTSHGLSAAVHGSGKAEAADGHSPAPAGAALDPEAATPSPPPSPPEKPGGMPSQPTDPAAPRPRMLRRFNSVIGAASHVGSASATAAAALETANNQASGALFAAPKAASRRRAALIASLWLGAKLALNIVESLTMQLTGFEVFETEDQEERYLGMSFHQPLVISMVAGFVVVNFTSSRRSFLRILHDSSEPVYIAFFTLTGMTLQLDALLPNLPTALLIFSLRLAGIFVGSYWGGRLGGSVPEHYERYWMAFITQAGVALGLAQKVAGSFPSFGPALALCVTAEVVLNQLLGPILFKAAIVGVGEAHNEYAPSNGPSKLGVSPPARPEPRSAVVVAPAGDAEAAALCVRLRARGWQLAQCDTAFTLESIAATAAAADGASSPQMLARRAARLSQLAQQTSDPTLLALIQSLEDLASPPSTAPTTHAPSKKSFLRKLRPSTGAPAALAEPLLQAEHAGARGAEESSAALMELALLHAVSSLDALDVIVLLMPTDADALRVTRSLRNSSSLLQTVHKRQTSTTQLLVRVQDVAQQAALEAEPLPLGAFTMTTVTAVAAVPNLLAEVLHPESHWSHELDNRL